MKILVTDGIDQNAKEQLIEMGHKVVEQHYEPEKLKKEISQYSVVIVRSATKLTEEIIEQACLTDHPKLFIRAGVGIDNIDVSYAQSKGITVENTPNSSSNAVAELALGHMLALSRFIHHSNLTMRLGEWNKKQYKGSELSGKTLGLIGFGRIAQLLAQKAYALGMKVTYTNRSGEKPGFDDYTYVDMDTLLKESDHISLHVPFDGKKAYIGKKELKKMKPSAYLINTARGGVVDEQAVMDALDKENIAGYGADVFENEPSFNQKLAENPKVSVTPHIGGATKEGQFKIGNEIIEVIKKWEDEQ